MSQHPLGRLKSWCSNSTLTAVQEVDPLEGRMTEPPPPQLTSHDGGPHVGKCPQSVNNHGAI